MLSSRQVIDTYFLEARHMLLEIAALLDRHDAARAREAAGGATPAAPAPPNLMLLREAVAVLAADPSGRERTVELLELFARS